MVEIMEMQHKTDMDTSWVDDLQYLLFKTYFVSFVWFECIWSLLVLMRLQITIFRDVIVNAVMLFSVCWFL